MKYKYGEMTETLKKEYATEGKALSAIQMCLPSDSIHLFQDCKFSKELWDALTAHCEGDTNMKKNRIKLLIRQYEVFNGLRTESLDQLITRFSHLITELSYFGERYAPTKLVDKFLDALPKNWDDYVHGLQEEKEYESYTLKEIFSKLRTREMKRKAKDGLTDFQQNPSLYHANGLCS